MGSLFSLITIALKVLGLWDGFLSFVDATRLADAEIANQKRDAALTAASAATTPAEAQNAETAIVNSKP